MSKINKIKTNNITYDVEDTSKQDLLIPGRNITIENNVISADASYSLPIAGQATLGGVKVGKNLSIDDIGKLSSKDFNVLLKNVRGIVPPSVQPGDKYYNPSTNRIYTYTNNSWDGGTYPEIGISYINTSDYSLYLYDGVTLREISGGGGGGGSSEYPLYVISDNGTSYMHFKINQKPTLTAMINFSINNNGIVPRCYFSTADDGYPILTNLYFTSYPTYVEADFRFSGFIKRYTSDVGDGFSSVYTGMSFKVYIDPAEYNVGEVSTVFWTSALTEDVSDKAWEYSTTAGFYVYSGRDLAKVNKVILPMDTLPALVSSNLNRIYMYTGVTDANYTNGHIYQCVYKNNEYVYEELKQASDSGGGGGGSGMTLSDWYEESGIDEYSSSSAYATGDFVYHNSLIYVCIIPISVPESFDSSKWTQITYIDYLNRVLIGNALGGSY